jgi:hypothetical protein
MDRERKFREIVSLAAENGDAARFHLVPVEYWDGPAGRWRPTALWSPITAGRAQSPAMAAVLFPDGRAQGEMPGIRLASVPVSALRLAVPVEARTAEMISALVVAATEETFRRRKLTQAERLAFYQARWAAWAAAWEEGHCERSRVWTGRSAHQRSRATVRRSVRGWAGTANNMAGILGRGVKPCYIFDGGSQLWRATVATESAAGFSVLAMDAPHAVHTAAAAVRWATSWGIAHELALRVVGWGNRAAWLDSVLGDCQTSEDDRETHPLAVLFATHGTAATQEWIATNTPEKEPAGGRRTIQPLPPEAWGLSSAASG